MAAQLTGVLRETVACDGAAPAVDSALFLSERLVPGDPRLLEGAWRRLPDLRLDQADPAVADILPVWTAEPEARDALLAAVCRAKPLSAEARLRRADAMTATGGQAELDPVMALLDAALIAC